MNAKLGPGYDFKKLFKSPVTAFIEKEAYNLSLNKDDDGMFHSWNHQPWHIRIKSDFSLARGPII